MTGEGEGEACVAARLLCTVECAQNASFEMSTEAEHRGSCQEGLLE